MASRILIIDDEAELRQALKVRLEGAGYDVITACDGSEGLNKARDNDVDLILLDVMMPKLEGYEVCRLLKFDKKHLHIPIIMLTAKSQKIDKRTGIEVGADDFVIKPFDCDKLISKIEQYLGGKDE